MMYPAVPIRIADIKRKVAADYGLTVDDIDGRDRRERICEARHAAMILAYHLTDHSKAHISVLFKKHPNLLGETLTQFRRRPVGEIRKNVRRLTFELIGRP